MSGIPFKASKGYPDQLRPEPFSVYSAVHGSACVCVIRRDDKAELSLGVRGGHIAVDFKPAELRLLAAQLIAAAELVEAGADPRDEEGS